jgi:putative oxidoreductase
MAEGAAGAYGLKEVSAAVVGTSNDMGPMIARLTLGLVMLPHGAQKLLGWFGGFGFEATIGSFTEMGIPWLFAFLVVVAEFFGALGLISGLLGRIAAFGIGVVMAVAALVHVPFGFFMNWMGNQQGEGFEFHLLAIGLALVVMLKGSGAWSVDRMLTARDQV